MGKKANLTIETTGVEMVGEIDLEGWEKASDARKYKTIIRKGERMLENGKARYYAIEMESLIRKIKTGLVQGEPIPTIQTPRTKGRTQ